MGKSNTGGKRRRQDQLTSMEELNATMISHARQIARTIDASPVISESTGGVRIFNQGKIFMEIEKAGKD